MAKRMALMIVILAIIGGALYGFNVFKKQKIAEAVAAFQSQPITVSTTKAEAQTWTETIAAVGSLAAVNGVEVNPQVSGIVSAIKFQSGQEVKAGDLLLELDSSLEQANLGNVNAQVKLAEITYKRNEILAQKGDVPQTTLDQATAQLQEARSSKAQLETQIKQKSITAPFAGVLGIRQVDLGQFINAGTPIVSLQSLDPLYVNFTLPEQHLGQVTVGLDLKITLDAFPGKTFDGKITSLDSQIDVQTRNFQVQGTVGNPDKALLPGLFADLAVVLPKQDKVVVVPQSAIDYNLYGDSAYIVEDGGKDDSGQAKLTVKRVFVTLGARQGNLVAVASGVKAGDEVVAAGQLKLQNGSRVAVDNSVSLTPPDKLPLE